MKPKLIIPVLLVLALVACPAVQTNLTPDEQNRAIISAAQTELGNLWDQALAYKVQRAGAFDKTFEAVVRPAYLLTVDAIGHAANVAEHGGSPAELSRTIKDAIAFFVEVLAEQGVLK